MARVTKRHPWLNPTKDALAFAEGLNAKAYPETQNGIPLPLVSAALPPTTLKDRRAMLKGTFRSPGVRSRAVSIYTRRASLLPRVETVYGDRGAPIGKVLREYDAVTCPSCETAIPLVAWWEHGCSRPLTGRSAEECLGSFEALTAGAAAPTYEDEPEAVPCPVVEMIDDPEIRWRGMFPCAFAVLAEMEAERMAA